MKRIIIFIGTLVIYGCSNGLELGDFNIYRYSDNGDAYFPNEIYSNLDSTKGKPFDADIYSKLLHQLHEKVTEPQI